MCQHHLLSDCPCLALIKKIAQVKLPSHRQLQITGNSQQYLVGQPSHFKHLVEIIPSQGAEFLLIFHKLKKKLTEAHRLVIF